MPFRNRSQASLLHLVVNGLEFCLIFLSSQRTEIMNSNELYAATLKSDASDTVWEFNLGENSTEMTIDFNEAIPIR